MANENKENQEYPGTLVEAINQVMAECENIEKNTSIGMGRSAYKGVSDKDVKLRFNRALRSAGLCLVPVEIEDDLRLTQWEEPVMQNGQPIPGLFKKKQSVFVSVKTKYVLRHISGEDIVLVGYGHGTDTQDKAAGKATTYALKYAMMYFGLTATGEIDDTDSVHSNEIPVPQHHVPAPQQPPSQPAAPAPAPVAPQPAPSAPQPTEHNPPEAQLQSPEEKFITYLRNEKGMTAKTSRLIKRSNEVYGWTLDTMWSLIKDAGLERVIRKKDLEDAIS